MDTEHLAHISSDGEQYWAAVWRIWEKPYASFAVKSKLWKAQAAFLLMLADRILRSEKRYKQAIQ